MKTYTALVEVLGIQEEQTFKVPDLLEAETFIYNSVGIKNAHTGRSDKFLGIKRTRTKKQKK